MYTRELKPAPDKPVVNGKPVFGSFIGIFKDFNIQGLKRPFGDLPIPTIITNARVMESLRFAYCDENDIGEIEIFDARYFSFMETTLWNRKTGYRLAYRRIIPAGIIHIPRFFENSVTACRTRSRYVRILTKLQNGFIHADFDFIGSDSRPPCEGRLEMNLNARDAAKVSFLLPYGVKRRCLGSCMLTAPVSGWIGTRYDDHRIQEDSAVGYFEVRKAYFSLRTKINQMIGIGRTDGKTVSFHVSSSVSHDDSRYNDNVLFVDGKAHPLPPVRITRPAGLSGPWVIQDTESMVDLTFTPLSDSPRYLSAFFLRTDYHTVYGVYDGCLLSGDGEKILLKGFPGIGKKVRLRI